MNANVAVGSGQCLALLLLEKIGRKNKIKSIAPFQLPPLPAYSPHLKTNKQTNKLTLQNSLKIDFPKSPIPSSTPYQLVLSAQLGPSVRRSSLDLAGIFCLPVDHFPPRYYTYSHTPLIPTSLRGRGEVRIYTAE